MPFLLAHQIGDPGIWTTLIAAFVSFSLAASALYLVNDMLGIEADRMRPTKRLRPFARGAAPVPIGLGVAVPALFYASL